MALRHGFKSELETISLAVRGELGLAPHERFDPLELATHLEIPVVMLDDLRERAPEEVEHLLQRRKSEKAQRHTTRRSGEPEQDVQLAGGLSGSPIRASRRRRRSALAWRHSTVGSSRRSRPCKRSGEPG